MNLNYAQEETRKAIYCLFSEPSIFFSKKELSIPMRVIFLLKGNSLFLGFRDESIFGINGS